MPFLDSARAAGRQSLTEGVTKWDALAADWRRIQAAYSRLAEAADGMLIGQAYRAGEAHARSRVEAADSVARALEQIRDQAFGAIPLGWAVLAVAGYTFHRWEDVAEQYIQWRREADAYAARVAELEQLNRALENTTSEPERRAIATTIVTKTSQPVLPEEESSWGWWVLGLALLGLFGFAVHQLVISR